MKSALMLPLLVVGLACSSSDQNLRPDAASLDQRTDAPAPDQPRPDTIAWCGTGNRPLPSGLTVLSWDDGTAKSHVRKQTWAPSVDGKTYEMAKVPLREAVRFDLAHPARIHGFQVQWGNLPTSSGGKTELKAGLYRDFGYNGFDFWEKEPLWSGTRCLEDIQEGAFVTYVFDKPVEIAHPGLVYVAHAADKPEDPVFMFDGSTTGNGKCEVFKECHSSFNLPTASVMPTGSYYNGTSFSFQNDFLVRLYVEYTKQQKDSERSFQKVSGIASNKSSVAWGDVDNDGWDDLLVGSTLYRNNQGTFTDISTASGLATLGSGAAGGVFGDYDNDGSLDLFLFFESSSKADLLLKGDGKGTFVDVTAKAKIVDQQSQNLCGSTASTTASPTAAAAWVDLDADGYLDLYLANFICWTNYTYYVDTVWHNRGDGTFEDWTKGHGFGTDVTASRNVAPADIEGDGDMDIFVNNYVLQPNLLYRNLGSGTFSEDALTLGAAGNARFYAKYYYGHTIGSAWGDLDNDGDLDLVAANLAHPRFWHFSDRSQILLNDGKGTFTDKGGKTDKPYGDPTGLRYQETHSVPLLGDFDLDGNLDLVITCVYDGRPTDFYWGKGDGTFTLDAYTTGLTTENGWGLAASDFDRDGDLDLMATDLFKNQKSTSGRHWLQVRVVGNVKANRAGLGAVVTVKAGGKTLVRQVQGGTGKGCQDSLYLHFGLGAASSASEIVVAFPGGKKVTYKGPLAADQRLWLYEDGTSKAGWTGTP